MECKFLFRNIVLLFSMILMPLLATAQSEVTPPAPTAVVTDQEGASEELAEGDSYEGEAPLAVHFASNATEYDDFSLVCVWTFTRQEEYEPFLTRYDKDVDYEFREAGTFLVRLNAKYTHRTIPNLELEYEFEPFAIRIAESSLKVPNAFSPNGDGINDYFNVFDVKSIVSFSAAIYNRWGQQLYSWGIEEMECEECGWDGTYKGKPVKDGVYFVVVNARGADGVNYEIKADVNLLRGYIDEVAQ
ncbi:MAG: gliding motility-associated C-terminal domain-containing protein [Bacteroidaceae bacterium]|nr:gliding motility-associated C-terminal domain-containing protein [Bacteroidaceae bacterium]